MFMYLFGFCQKVERLPDDEDEEPFNYGMMRVEGTRVYMTIMPTDDDDEAFKKVMKFVHRLGVYAMEERGYHLTVIAKGKEDVISGMVDPGVAEFD